MYLKLYKEICSECKELCGLEIIRIFMRIKVGMHVIGLDFHISTITF